VSEKKLKKRGIYLLDVEEKKTCKVEVMGETGKDGFVLNGR